MEPNLPSGSGHKRPRPMDDIAGVEALIENPTEEKRVRFPKGKKAKHGDAPIHITGPQEGEVAPADARAAAKEREMRRHNQKIEMFGDAGDLHGAVAAEVKYQGESYGAFTGDGEVPIEPFNLEKEREEGYFDENGNFVEYVEKNKVKDAWLDSIAAGGVKLYTPKPKAEGGGDVEPEEEHIGKIKRRIADVLEEGETVLQALRRLKGNAKGDKKVKMSAEAKRVFDQLTEDAMTLLDKHGEYNVNQEQKEIFEREAQGYESLERARNAMLSGTDDGGFDMFGDDEDNATDEQQGNVNGGVDSSQVVNDYVLDESSGYYYSSSSGYYYDPTTGLYCSAASGVWYSYNEETGAYDEVPHDQAAAAAETVVN